jgi:hypothetical protein
MSFWGHIPTKDSDLPENAAVFAFIELINKLLASHNKEVHVWSQRKYMSSGELSSQGEHYICQLQVTSIGKYDTNWR